MHIEETPTPDWKKFASSIRNIDAEIPHDAQDMHPFPIGEKAKRKLGLALLPPLLLGAAVMGIPEYHSEMLMGQQESTVQLAGLSASDTAIVKGLEEHGIDRLITVEEVGEGVPQARYKEESEETESAESAPLVQMVSDSSETAAMSTSTENADSGEEKRKNEKKGSVPAAEKTASKSQSPSEPTTDVPNARSASDNRPVSSGATADGSAKQAERNGTAAPITIVDGKSDPADDYYVLLIGDVPTKKGDVPVLVSHVTSDATTYTQASELAGAEAEKTFEADLAAAYSDDGATAASELLAKETGIQAQVVAQSETAALQERISEKKEAAKEKAKITEEQKKFFTIIDDKLWFDQNDYPSDTYQNGYSIASHGCGLCSTTVALDMLLGKSWGPVYVAGKMKSWADSHGGLQYCVSAGTAYGPWADTVSGAFGVSVYKASSVKEVKEALTAGAMVVAGNGGNVFKTSSGSTYYSGGHLICFYKTDGKNVWAKDSAGSAGGPSILYDADDFERFFAASGRTYIITRA